MDMVEKNEDSVMGMGMTWSVLLSPPRVDLHVILKEIAGGTEHVLEKP